jgi:hypothetical protein
MVVMPYGENRYLEVSRDIIPSIKLWFSRLLIRCFIIPVGETASLIRNCSKYEAVTPTPAVLVIVFCGDGSTSQSRSVFVTSSLINTLHDWLVLPSPQNTMTSTAGVGVNVVSILVILVKVLEQ